MIFQKLPTKASKTDHIIPQVKIVCHRKLSKWLDDSWEDLIRSDSVPTPSVKPPGVVPEFPRPGRPSGSCSRRFGSVWALALYRQSLRSVRTDLPAARGIVSGSPCPPLPVPFPRPPSSLRESSRNLRVPGEPPAHAPVASDLSDRWRSTDRSCAPFAYLSATRLIPYRGDLRLFWDQTNWETLCKKYHDNKTGSGL